MNKVLFYLSFVLLVFPLTQQANAQCSINGSSSINTGQTRTYTTTAVSGASYFWSATGGVSIVGSKTSTSVSIRANSGTSGRVCVVRYKDRTAPCCACRTINIIPPPPPCPTDATISQIAGACMGDVFRFRANLNTSASVTYSWTVFNGATIVGSNSGSTVRVQSPSNSGFAVRVTITCGGQSFTRLTLAEFSAACGGGGPFPMSVFPSPGNRSITVALGDKNQVSSLTETYQVEVVNKMGEVVMTQTLTQSAQKIDTSKLPNDLYFIRTKSKGKVVNTKRWIKE